MGRYGWPRGEGQGGIHSNTNPSNPAHKLFSHKQFFTQTVFTQTVFTQTVFTQTVFTQTVFSQTVFTQTVFTQTPTLHTDTHPASLYLPAPPPPHTKPLNAEASSQLQPATASPWHPPGLPSRRRCVQPATTNFRAAELRESLAGTAAAGPG